MREGILSLAATAVKYNNLAPFNITPITDGWIRIQQLLVWVIFNLTMGHCTIFEKSLLIIGLSIMRKTLLILLLSVNYMTVNYRILLGQMIYG